MDPIEIFCLIACLTSGALLILLFFALARCAAMGEQQYQQDLKRWFFTQSRLPTEPDNQEDQDA